VFAMRFFPPFFTVAFAALAVAFLAPSAHGQELKVVYSPELAGGEVFVEGVLHVRFVGAERTPANPSILSTTWKTYALRAVRRVIVSELRMPGQPADSWKVEHLALVAKVATAFPMLTAPRTVGTYSADDALIDAQAGTPAIVPLFVPRSRLPRLPRRIATLSIEHGSTAADSTAAGGAAGDASRATALHVFELPQPYTLIPTPALDRASRPT